MCGIFGFVKKDNARIDKQVMYQLAKLNESRGRDSFGYFSEKSFLKRVGKITDQYPHTWVSQNDQSRFIGGHCRMATRGEVTRRNCHPFFFEGPAGKVVGIHNGVVPAPYSYEVDSEWIFDGIAKEGLSFLDDLDGYWGIAFVFNGEFYLAACNQELSFCIDDDVLYFSSDKLHLKMATGCECHDIDDTMIKIRDDFSFEVTEFEPRGWGYNSYSYWDDDAPSAYEEKWEDWTYDKESKSWIREARIEEEREIERNYGLEEWEAKEGLSLGWLDEDDAYDDFKKRFHQLSDEEWEAFEELGC